MFKKETKDVKAEWRGGVYLCSADNNLEADILESKLRGEGIVCIRNYEGAGNYIEIFAGISTATAIDLYVAADKLEDAENFIVPVDLDECKDFDQTDLETE